MKLIKMGRKENRKLTEASIPPMSLRILSIVLELLRIPRLQIGQARGLDTDKTGVVVLVAAGLSGRLAVYY